MPVASDQRPVRSLQSPVCSEQDPIPSEQAASSRVRRSGSPSSDLLQRVESVLGGRDKAAVREAIEVVAQGPPALGAAAELSEADGRSVDGPFLESWLGVLALQEPREGGYCSRAIAGARRCVLAQRNLTFDLGEIGLVLQLEISCTDVATAFPGTGLTFDSLTSSSSAFGAERLG